MTAWIWRIWTTLCSTRIRGMIACGWLMLAASAAEPPASYEQVIAGRADKILASLSLEDAADRSQVHAALVDFYRSVNAWHEQHAGRRQELKRAATDSARESLATLEADLAAVRRDFEDRLAKVLPAKSIARVKDGLTYNVVHVTERAYHDMLPDLTAGERERIHAWLVEARDLAISEGSSEAKHGVFGRYKGKINNFLSQAGYDLKQAERDWQARRKAAAEAEPGEPKESK